MANPSACAAPFSQLETALLEDPFTEYAMDSPQWTKGPRRPHSQWRCVMSRAWAIFRAASAWNGVWNPACEWGAAFQQAFLPPYTNVVLPACFDASGDPLGRLLRHLEGLRERVGETRDPETIKQHLVRMRISLGPAKGN